MSVLEHITSASFEYLPQRIREARQALGLTQLDAAKIAGKPASWWNHFETGHRRPSLESLQLICSVLNVTATDLLKF